MPSSPSADDSSRPSLLRRGEQGLLAALVAVSLSAMMAAWWWQGGTRGRLIEVDQAEPIEIHFQVDINTAPWPELAQLPQIGEALARRIVESRESDGPFRSHDELRRVHGIGPKTVEGVRPYLLPIADEESIAGN